jgi:hypothetical protein
LDDLPLRAICSQRFHWGTLKLNCKSVFKTGPFKTESLSASPCANFYHAKVLIHGLSSRQMSHRMHPKFFKRSWSLRWQPEELWMQSLTLQGEIVPRVQDLPIG